MIAAAPDVGAFSSLADQALEQYLGAAIEFG
jgi:hypothetical protein